MKDFTVKIINPVDRLIDHFKNDFLNPEAEIYLDPVQGIVIDNVMNIGSSSIEGKHIKIIYSNSTGIPTALDLAKSDFSSLEVLL
jgi:hypothetical protein